MNVYLDGEPLAFPEPRTFASALRSASARAEAKGRVLVEVKIDGAHAPEAMIDEPPEEPVGSDVRLVSVEPRSLVRVTLMDAVDALEAARDRQSRCAELIQTGKVEEALAPLSEAIQTWQTVRDAVEKSAAMLGMRLDELSAGSAERGMEDLIRSLATGLAEVRRSLSGEDWSALADVLAYDMGEQAEQWKAALTSAADGLRPAR
jgi:hypothetical protein